MHATAPAGDPFEALGNPHRRAIVALLADSPRSVQEIADLLPISRPAVSRHLRLLSEAGLVADQPVGARRLYRVNNLGLAGMREYLESVWGAAAGRFRFFAENTAPAEKAP
jgi:DNA-binding transcriptional ArsR family regulator